MFAAFKQDVEAFNVASNEMKKKLILRAIKDENIKLENIIDSEYIKKNKDILKHLIPYDGLFLRYMTDRKEQQESKTLILNAVRSNASAL
mmetsp:Transcript_24862/g.22041  ORF Transcript_24862/g.22041 Transcript_24862/m.22041 type:complete len:90 (+) Transcript_24862:3211-3480(+)